MALIPGTDLGPYEVVALLGAGGMGEVYRARDTRLGRDVAIKALPEGVATDAERLQRFQREAQILASLNHPNIAQVYGLEKAEQTFCIVMEFVDGETLQERLKRGPIPLQDVLPIAKQIAGAVEAAHERGIIHRDLKPGNVKITKDGEVKILDFGLAKAFEPEPPADLATSNSPTLSMAATQRGVVLGTAGYMSPEQAAGKPVDRRADIWSFGVVLWEMLTGRGLFTGGETISHTLADVLRAAIDFAKLPAYTPQGIQELLRRCLDRDTKTRLRDIGEARVTIEKCLASPASEALSTHQLTNKAVRWLWPGVAGLFLMMFAVVSIIHFREQPAARHDVVSFQIPVPANVRLSPSGSFSISPDGRKLVFLASSDGGAMRLWLRAMDSDEVRPIPGTDVGPTMPPPFWSPDSRSIAFTADGRLKRLDISGGPVQTICTVPATSPGGSWNSDDVIVFGATTSGIMKVPAQGGTPSPVTKVDASRGDASHSYPVFLPDGRHFFYVRSNADAEKSGIYIGSIDSKPEEQSTKLFVATDTEAGYLPSASGMGQLLFRHEQNLMAQPFDEKMLKTAGEPVPVAEQVGFFFSHGLFSTSQNGVLVYQTETSAGMQLTWFNQQGNVVSRVGEPDVFLTLALSPDGTKAAFRRSAFGSGRDLWLLDLRRGNTERFTFAPGINQSPVWSPDGNRIVFQSNREGIFNLYEKAIGGVNDEQLLLKTADNKVPTSWSRDGRFLLYHATDAKTRHDVWVLPMQGAERIPVPLLRTRFDEIDPVFSPDGHWIAYVSNESGKNEIYVRAFAQGPRVSERRWMVTRAGGTKPWWFVDGKQLRYIGPNGHVMAVDVTRTDTAFDSGEPRDMLQPPRTAAALDMAPDGRFLVAIPAEQSSPASFHVIVNWPASIRK